MRVSNAKEFCKNEDCPSSNELLEFQVGELSKRRAGQIHRHLASCEFCAAEVEFYGHYPQEDPAIENEIKSEIPAPLFELAEALLRNRNGDHKLLNSLLNDSKLVTDKA